MENLIINKTNETPYIDFKTNGELLIEGISLPENVYVFFGKLDAWLEGFKINLPPIINLTFDIEYLNTASSVAVLNFLRKLVDYSTNKSKVNIVWRYLKDDDDMLDEGDKLQSLTKFKFEFLEK